MKTEQTFWLHASFCLMLLAACTNGKKSNTALKTATEEGTLFIIGGGERDDTLMQQMIDISGWNSGEWITSVSLASSYDSAYYWINDQLQRMTGQATIRFDSSAVFDPMKLDSLRRSKIIFIGGGDQMVMMRRIQGSQVKEIINEAYRNGATIGGTSAGAAVMSEMMITGNQLLDSVYESTFSTIRKGNIEIKEGLGLLDSVIIDQHFIARSRYNRLITAVLEYPEYCGIGIDEATALIVSGDSGWVAGESQVVVMETPDDITVGTGNTLGGKNIDVHVYVAGEGFPIKK